ncbi:uncharacterized protein LOC144088493 [Stigmatopora argus]
MSQVSLPAEGGERHQEYVCGTRTSIHSAVGAYSTVAPRGPPTHPLNLDRPSLFGVSPRRRRGEAPRVRLRDVNQHPFGGRRILHCCAKGPTHTPTKLGPAKSFRWCSTIEAKYPFELKSENFKDVGINPCTSYISYISRCPRSPRFGKPFRWKTVHPTSHPFLPLSLI